MKIRIEFKNPVQHSNSINKGFDRIKLIKAIRYVSNSGLRQSKECAESIYIIEEELHEEQTEYLKTVEAMSHLIYIKQCGGTILFGASPWSDFVDEIKEMAFVAKLQGNNLALIEFDRIINEHAQYEKLNKLSQ
jgi:hypothetical protein